MKNCPPRILTALALCALSGTALHAQSYTWIPTASGSYDWDNATNWTPDTGFPNASGAVANVNSDLLAAQTIRLREEITIGTLNIGDAAASSGNFAFTIGNVTGETFSLNFDSGAANTAAQLNLNSTGTPTNLLAVPVLLNSNLNINLGTGAQILSIASAGSLATGTGATARTVTVTNGTSGTNQFTITGDLTGNGVFTNNSNASVTITGTKSFTGTFVLNKGGGPVNAGSLTVTSGSIANASEVIINGFLSGGATQNGGILHSGNSSATATNPGQRLTQNRITMNSGTLVAGGQAMSGAALTTLVEDTVNNLDFNSGYSLLGIAGNGNSAGTRLNITTLERSVGASAFIRSSTLGGTARITIGNSSAFLKGAGGAESTTTMSIIPWMLAANTNGSAGSADTFATYTENGIRGLVTTTGIEYATSLTAGADANVSTASAAIAAPDTSATINAYRFTSGGASNIGTGKTLILKSGGLIFTNNNGAIGGSGSATAGTLQFGLDNTPTEGVVWANGSNVNTIGASISGTGGLTKAGTGTLVLTGDNTFSGTTFVGGGTLQIGDGVIASDLGLSSQVTISNGATLSLFNGNAIADTAILKFEQFGLFNGKLSLNTGVNETIGALYFGDTLAAAGSYGSTQSGATFQNDTYFSGTGVVTVVPEPTTTGIIFGGVGMLMLIRRRRR